MDQLSIAAQRTAADFEGGAKRLAQLLGTNYQVLVNRLNPNCEAHKLGLHEALAMMLHTGDVQMLEVMAAELGYSVSRKTTTAAEDLLGAIMQTSCAYGDVAKVVREAVADGRVTPRELADIRDATKAAQQALDGQLATVTELHKAQAPR